MCDDLQAAVQASEDVNEATAWRDDRIRDAHASGFSLRRIAAETQLHFSTVRRIVHEGTD